MQRRSDLRQLGGADQRVGLLQEPPAGALVIVRAVVRLGIAVAGAEVVTTPGEKRNDETKKWLLRNSTHLLPIHLLNQISEGSSAEESPAARWEERGGRKWGGRRLWSRQVEQSKDIKDCLLSFPGSSLTADRHRLLLNIRRRIFA